MPTILTHALSGAAVGAGFRRPLGLARIWFAGAVCAALPDLDVLGFRLGIHYGDVLGHRGFTHSLAFAALLAALAVSAVFPRGAPGWSRGALWLYLFVATASHGVLDALTDGGRGVAFFSPFSNVRYFFPVQPVQVSPIGVRSFMSSEGLTVLSSEVRWIWLPSVLLLGGAFVARAAASVLARRE
ncbi:MAG TPA: metal-dependent hydrolase [Candidatus Eisenbacteria bacterium]|nr:metal-dependent hydrolase [Candidatus Eisenbacteria bacterium]